MYRIARMNMYLHGDGGSNIFYADSLDKNIARIGGEDLEVDKQIEELRTLFLKNETKFDLILSNPPFSLQYSRENKEQKKILDQYALSRDEKGGKVLQKLISSVMFIERYKDLVSDDGKIVAVIDDSVLSGSSYRHVRNYIRQNFIIEGIISLPGDAFKRASARVKTSVIILRKRSENDNQSDVFMMSSVYLGLEDKTAKRIGISVQDLPMKKEDEKKKITSAYKAFLNGTDTSNLIPFENCKDRLDVKFCIKDTSRKVEFWKSKGLAVDELANILTPAQNRARKVVARKEYPLLIVNYNGEVGEGETLNGADTSYSKLYSVKEWDLLISNMGFGRGAVSVVPPHHAGKYVSNEYTILRAFSNEAAIFYWNLLRTKEILGDILSSTTGMNRGRIKWDAIKNVIVPTYQENTEIRELTNEIELFWKALAKFENRKEKHVAKVSEELDVDGADSFERWLSFKPPE